MDRVGLDTYREDLFVVSNIHGGDTILVARDELRMLLEQHSQALSMAILANHVAGRVSVAIFGVIVGALIEESLQDLGIASDARHVQGGSQVLGLAVEMSAKLRKDIDHLDVALVARHVKRRPSV